MPFKQGRHQGDSLGFLQAGKRVHPLLCPFPEIVEKWFLTKTRDGIYLCDPENTGAIDEIQTIDPVSFQEERGGHLLCFTFSAQLLGSMMSSGCTPVIAYDRKTTESIMHSLVFSNSMMKQCRQTSLQKLLLCLDGFPLQREIELFRSHMGSHVMPFPWRNC